MESTELLDEIVIIGKAGIDATKTGAAMNITSAEINRMPSIAHGIADAIRMNPQVRVASDGAMHFLGMNNRYNSFQIDGVMNNDVYGSLPMALMAGRPAHNRYQWKPSNRSR